MRILLTNDDGITAPGLQAMCSALRTWGTVCVVAPDSAQSATSHAITVSRPIPVQPGAVAGAHSAFAVGGRPVDCVKLALSVLLDEPVDLVVSGINDGANVSTNVLYSGTVAAAANGALAGVPAVAVSLERGPGACFDGAARVALSLIQRLHEQHWRRGCVYNINIPAQGRGRLQGVKVAMQANQPMTDSYIHAGDTPPIRTVPSDGGSRSFVLDGDFEDSHDHEADLHALRSGYVVVTPLQFNFTDHAHLETMRGWQWPDLPGTA